MNPDEIGVVPQGNERMIDTLRRAAKYKKLQSDPEIRRQWKDYKKRTKGMAQMTKQQWLDFISKDMQVEIEEPRVGELWYNN